MGSDPKEKNVMGSDPEEKISSGLAPLQLMEIITANKKE